MNARLREIVLAAYSSRSRVTRDRDGTIHLLWESLGLRMNQGEFVELAATMKEAHRCPVRCGELARGCHGQAVRCPMGQIMLSHDRLTLWFSPEEFDQCCKLVDMALKRLADAEPLPALGKPIGSPQQSFPSPN
jgi:hypothetical protein